MSVSSEKNILSSAIVPTSYSLVVGSSISYGVHLAYQPLLSFSKTMLIEANETKEILQSMLQGASSGYSSTIANLLLLNLQSVTKVSSTSQKVVNLFDQNLTKSYIAALKSSFVAAGIETYLQFRQNIQTDGQRRYFLDDLIKGAFRGTIIGALSGACSLESADLTTRVITGGVVGYISGAIGVCSGKILSSAYRYFGWDHERMTVEQKKD